MSEHPEQTTAPTAPTGADTIKHFFDLLHEYGHVCGEICTSYSLNYDAPTEKARKAEIKQEFAAMLGVLVEDRERLDWLESRAMENEHVEINYTDAWTEPGDYGSILSSGPREFYLRDDGTENGPSLRAAIDAARPSAPRSAPAPAPLDPETPR